VSQTIAGTDVSVLRSIFNTRYADGAEQEILDVIDMALGVYDASRFNALVRTVNPFHYTITALVYIAKITGRVFSTLFLRPGRSRAPRLREEDVTRLEAVVSRLSDVEELIETRFAEMRDRQVQQYGENDVATGGPHRAARFRGTSDCAATANRPPQTTQRERRSHARIANKKIQGTPGVVRNTTVP
jgi:hypothetical protein